MQKFRFYLRFWLSVCRRFGLFGVRMACSYRFIHSSCRRFYAAKGSWATERSVSGYLAKGKRKAPRGCRLAVYLPTDTLLRDSGQEHRGINRLRMYQIRNPSLSEFVWRVLDRDAKRCACISQEPTKVPFEVYSEILRPQTQ